MVVCFSATQTAKAALDELMASGQFKDVSDAISFALINYQVIHQAVGQSGHTVIESPRPSASSESALEAQGKAHRSRVAALPDIFISHGLMADALTFLPMADAPHGDALSIPPNAWLWGQYNRFLPVKATCRALLNLMAHEPNGVPMEEANSKISVAAGGMGDYLSALDSRLFRRREEAMAAAFPNSTISGAQGRARFSAQFVGTIKQGKVIGLPAGLGLVGVASMKEPRLLLTEQGAAFAALPNPVMDGDGEPAARTLSQDETLHLLDHIKRYVPEELSAYVSILDGIGEGANAPEGLDSYLRQRFGLEDLSKMTSSFLATQRTGVVSRMVELGLIAREKDGLRVTYIITEVGQSFRS